ncbi:hypothetical protein RclHR1_08690004 [Rhizophagus clarus]|uniref:F-box domain-containing protein n=1 Tax=Rhizophagus clarus TaxID=94130 RepID=A0A2Z6S422_9GLOM|nr:hypothetical protein RclHR1_08690004 [Rhizophagus clarus]GES78668.1 hypothetical protein GLOIN_2v1764020 [Rhizophagus clarus]
MPKLNKDILFLIFEELQEDSEFLFSCLMVDRLWCETAIPILWKDPWRYNICYFDKYLFTIITFYLSNDIKEFLTSQGIQLPSISYKSLLFDYLSFCKSININVLNNIISVGSSDLYYQFLLQQEIYDLMIRKCPELKYLNIESIKHQIFYFSEAKARLESLCELKCDTSIDSSYFYGLASICHYIQRIIIINKCLFVNNGTCKLIEIQKNLKYFEWKDDFEREESENSRFIGDPYEGIFLALEKSGNTLNYLIISLQYIEFYNYESMILQDVLTKLHKLKTLIVSSDTFYTHDEKKFKMMVYPELEIFDMDFISLGEASSVIENSGGHLREIPLNYEYYEYCWDNFEEESLIFIRKIYNNCPKIENLALLISSSDEQFTELEKLLKTSKNLKSLSLTTISSDINHKTDEEIGKELLKILIRSKINNLREIKFYGSSQFSLKSMEEFLEKWRGRTALSIYTSGTIYKSKSDDYKNINMNE